MSNVWLRKRLSLPADNLLTNESVEVCSEMPSQQSLVGRYLKALR